MDSSDTNETKSNHVTKRHPLPTRTVSRFKNTAQNNKKFKRPSDIMKNKERGKSDVKLARNKSQEKKIEHPAAGSKRPYRMTHTNAKPQRSAQLVKAAKRSYQRRTPVLSSRSSIDIVAQNKSPYLIANHFTSKSCTTFNEPKSKSTNRLSFSGSKFCSKSTLPYSTEFTTDSTTLRRIHEAFVRAFAIPTHLYRYLSQRHRDRPIFLHRTLSYLKPRSDLKLNSANRPSLTTVLSRLNEKHGSLKFVHNESNKKHPIESICLLGTLPVNNWPHEIELIFEGFYDSEKELDWVTVEATVDLRLRLGWAWRRKICPGDTLMSINPSPIHVNCHNRITGLTAFPVNSPRSKDSDSSNESCRFSLTDLINLAKWNISGGRLKSAQLELHISATERRWLKRPEITCLNGVKLNGLDSLNSSCDSSPQVQSKQTKQESKHALNNHINNTNQIRKGLSSASYPVCYATAPLPLFFSKIPGDSYSSNQSLLLTPGLYELRLGVDSPDACDGVNKYVTKCPNGLVNGYKMDGNHLIHQVDDQGFGMNQSGTCSGRLEWRRIRFPKTSKALDEYSKWPRLRFRVAWLSNNNPQSDRVVLPIRGLELRKPEISNSNPEVRYSHKRSISNTTVHGNSNLTRNLNDCLPNQTSCMTNETSLNDNHMEEKNLDSGASEGFPSCLQSLVGSKITKKSSVHPITFCFIYGGNLQQWSESTDLLCPWCRLDCSRAKQKGPEALLIHLRTCHPRFRFKAIWNPSRSHLTLEVSLNEAYDGSNDCGIRRWGFGISNKFLVRHQTIVAGQLIGGWNGLGTGNYNGVDHHTGNGANGTNGNHSASPSLVHATVRIRRPIRRLPFTHLIFWRGAERINEQLHDPTTSVHPMVVGHNRVYYHTRTIQPIRACEFDVDSEAEDAPAWLCQHYQRKVEEFTDVNQGEKQIMQLWNSLLLSIRPSELVVCDSQILTLFCQFISQHAQYIHKRRLRTNLILHLANAVDYGLLSSGQMRQLVIIYDKCVRESNVTIRTTHNCTTSTTTAPTIFPTMIPNALVNEKSNITQSVRPTITTSSLLPTSNSLNVPHHTFIVSNS